MLKQTNLARAEALPLTGDTQSLAEQLGSAAGFAVLSADIAALPTGRIDSLPALRDFLSRYQAQILIPLEFPAIFRASILTSEGKARELIALDQSLAGEPALRDFAAASFAGCARCATTVSCNAIGAPWKTAGRTAGTRSLMA